MFAQTFLSFSYPSSLFAPQDSPFGKVDTRHGSPGARLPQPGRGHDLGVALAPRHVRQKLQLISRGELPRAHHARGSVLEARDVEASQVDIADGDRRRVPDGRSGARGRSG